MVSSSYAEFIERKSQIGRNEGFEPIWLPDAMFDFQSFLTVWGIRQGRGAIFADCGSGKTLMQLVWAENVVRHANGPVLLATPLAVGAQTLREAERFGIKARRSRNGEFDGEKCVWITNYEQLEKFDPAHFVGFVGDESSGIKDEKTNRKAVVCEFTRNLRYRLLCTATAAPNDFWELGTSSEALGLLGWRDMITTFFKQETTKDRLGWGRTKYRFRGHAEKPFWQWVCSWARSMRKPSDLGFSDERFALPPLNEHEIVVETAKCRDGMLFPIPASNMREEREERRLSIDERCEMAVDLAEKHNGQSILWCELNPEGDQLNRMLPNARQISGSMADDEKEELMLAFASGELKQLITKPKIGCWGLNFQNCSNVIMFPSHSFEQYYQAVRRCWRFGQKNPVNVNLIVNEGETGVLKNLRRKADQCERMFRLLTEFMGDAMRLHKDDRFPHAERMPSWL